MLIKMKRMKSTGDKDVDDVPKDELKKKTDDTKEPKQGHFNQR